MPQPSEIARVRFVEAREADLAPALYLFAVASGGAALVYQVVWAKMLSFAFGSTVLAASSVVAGFMGGMGVGAWGFHRLQARLRQPVLLYAGLELGIALSTALLTFAFAALPWVFAGVASTIQEGIALNVIRVVFVLLVLLVPSALMGATYPALCVALIRSNRGVDLHLGRLYGLNTLGAAAGALITGALLIEHFGLRGSILLANGVNVAIGIGALGLVRRYRSSPAEAAFPEASSQSIASRLPHWLTGLVLFGSGFTTLGYEMLWFAALRNLVGISVYALSVLLMVFLLGLGLGAFFLRRVAERTHPERDLGLCQLAIALLALLAIGAEAYVLGNPQITRWVSSHELWVNDMAWWLKLGNDAVLASVIMLPATLLMGLSFPLATRLFLGDMGHLGRRVGLSYLLANLGSILGATLVALLLLPTAGTIGGTRILAVVNALLGVAVLRHLRWPARSSAPAWSMNGVLGGLLGLYGMLALVVSVVFTQGQVRLVALLTAVLAAFLFLRTRWPKPGSLAWVFRGGAVLLLLLLGLLLPERLPFRGNLADRRATPHLKWEEENELGVVQVWTHRSHPDRLGMAIDGVLIGASGRWYFPMYSKQLILAHLPLQLDPSIRRSLIVGFASASTANALTGYPGLETIDSVEINSSVVRASRLFPEVKVLEDERAELVQEDITHYLLRSQQTYDLVISDGKQSEGHTGNAKLLSRDFYQVVKGRLSERGILIQWIPLATLAVIYQDVLRTFADSFEEMEVFLLPPDASFLVGSRHPIAARSPGAPAAITPPGVAAELKGLGFPQPDSLLALWVADRAAILEVLPPGSVNTWDRSPLEFAIHRASREEWTKGMPANIALLEKAHQVAMQHGGYPFPAVDYERMRLGDLVRRAYSANTLGQGARAAELGRDAVVLDRENPRARAAFRQLSLPRARQQGS
jgi:spermidine synthase